MRANSAVSASRSLHVNAAKEALKEPNSRTLGPKNPTLRREVLDAGGRRLREVGPAGSTSGARPTDSSRTRTPLLRARKARSAAPSPE
jgi:hypothetical protein